MNIRLKRVIAFIIDWNLTLFPFTFICFIISTLSWQTTRDSLPGILILLSIFSALTLFVLRDVIFKGCSLGKRIFNLHICDNKSLEPANKKQLFLRNIFIFICTIDGIILLATGETIGDRISNTVILQKEEFEAYKNEQILTTQPRISLTIPKKKKAKKILLIFTIIIGCVIAFVGLIQIILNSQKNTEEYKIAYNYLIESNDFKSLNLDESKIRMNQYSSQANTSVNNDSVSQTVKIGFIIDREVFEVVCHKENNKWQVCNKCTTFS